MFKSEISTFPTFFPVGLNLVDVIEGVYNLTLFSRCHACLMQFYIWLFSY